MYDLEQHKQQARLLKKENKRFLQKLKKRPPKDLDQVVRDLDAEVWEEVDCLQCANCCKSISPVFKSKDIERISQALKMKPGEFTSEFLQIDEDDDYVLKSAPCPFLLADNRCEIYEVRPNACREYPHTGKRKFHQLLDLTYKNTLYCPAALKVVEGMKKTYS